MYGNNNKNNPALRLLAALFFFCLFAPMAAGQDNPPTWVDQLKADFQIQNTGGGNGKDKDAPILIATAQELAYLAKQVNTGGDLTVAANVDNSLIKNEGDSKGFKGYYFALSADIDLSAHYWMPIGNYPNFTEGHPFRGNFDGRGFTVSRLKININNLQERFVYGGLFGYSELGTLQNIGVVLDSIYVKVKVIIYAGGIAGKADNINNCYVVGKGIEVDAEDKDNIDLVSCFVGGIVGTLGSGSQLKNCYAAVNVKGEACLESNVGGICGLLESKGTLSNCLAANKEIIGDNCNRIVGGYTSGVSSNYASAKTLVNGHRVSSNLDGLNGADTWLGTFESDLKNASSGNNDWNTAWTWPEGKLPQLNNSISEKPEIDASTVLADLKDLSLELNKTSGEIFLAYKGDRWLYNEPGSKDPLIPFNGVVKGGGCPVTILNTVLKTKATDVPELIFDGGTWDSSDPNAILKVNTDANMIMKVTNNVVLTNTAGPAIDNAGTLTIEAESPDKLFAFSPDGAIKNTGMLALKGNSIYLAGGASTIAGEQGTVFFNSPMVEWRFASSLQDKLINWEISSFNLDGAKYSSCRNFVTTALVPEIWVEGTLLCIRMPEALPATSISIYTPDGRLHASFGSTPGLSQRQLPTGMYIVRVGDTVRKVVVRKT